MKELDDKQLKYLEIYPSEVAANKILSHMDKMLEDKPKVYKKTILRYKQLANILIACLDKINKFIESETLLSSDDTEFDELSKPLEDTIKPFKNSAELKRLSDSTEEFDEMHTSAKEKYNTASNIAQYSSILQTGANAEFGYEEINQCARLINMWFQARIPRSSKNTEFRYNVSQIPLWISHIIITYGYYFEQGKVYDFEQELKHWCKEIQEDPHNTYRVPYCVYNIGRSDNHEYYTLSAVLISDILLEKCYYPMLDKCKGTNCDVASIVKANNPGLSGAIRTRINKQDELLETLGFTSTEGGNK